MLYLYEIIKSGEAEMAELPLYKESLEIENYTQMNIEILENKVSGYEMLLLDPDTLPRQAQEIRRILGHLVFEITRRNSDR